ncbi:MAG: peptide/nickel transport system permease protein, partial [Gammaproteobacteria bacterium]
AVQQKDYTMVQSIVMLVVLTFAVTNLVIDVLYATLDPRIRYS